MWYIGRCYVYKHSLYAFSTLQTSHDVGHEDPRTGEICWYALHLVFEMHQRKLSPCGPFFLSFCPSLSLFFFSSSFVYFFIFWVFLYIVFLHLLHILLSRFPLPAFLSIWLLPTDLSAFSSTSSLFPCLCCVCTRIHTHAAGSKQSITKHVCYRECETSPMVSSRRSKPDDWTDAISIMSILVIGMRNGTRLRWEKYLYRRSRSQENRVGLIMLHTAAYIWWYLKQNVNEGIDNIFELFRSPPPPPQPHTTIVSSPSPSKQAPQSPPLLNHPHHCRVFPVTHQASTTITTTTQPPPPLSGFPRHPPSKHL